MPPTGCSSSKTPSPVADSFATQVPSGASFRQGDRRWRRESTVHSWWVRTARLSVPMALERRTCYLGFTWDFVIAAVTFPLLGADFLCAHNLLVDVGNRRLVNSQTFASFACTQGVAVYSGWSKTLAESDQYLQLLAEFPDLTKPTFSAPAVKHGVEHHIETNGPPLHARARCLNPEKLSVARAEFAHMEQVGIIRRSNSPWASPLHIVPVTPLCSPCGPPAVPVVATRLQVAGLQCGDQLGVIGLTWRRCRHINPHPPLSHSLALSCV